MLLRDFCSHRLQSHIFRYAALNIPWRSHVFSINLYSVELPESCSCNVAAWQSLHWTTCTIVYHSDTYPHPYECAFETSYRKRDYRENVSPTTSILIPRRGEVLNGQRIESDGAERKRRAETEVSIRLTSRDQLCVSARMRPYLLA